MNSKIQDALKKIKEETKMNKIEALKKSKENELYSTDDFLVATIKGTDIHLMKWMMNTSIPRRVKCTYDEWKQSHLKADIKGSSGLENINE